MITSIIVLSMLGETINIMTLGGLALAVGILVDDATVAIENISHQLEQGKTLEQAILDGAHQIAIPTLVSTLSICIVFVPMFLLTGVAHYLFIPLAEAVVFAMLASYFFSRTLVPTLAKYLLRYHHKPADLHHAPAQMRNRSCACTTPSKAASRVCATAIACFSKRASRGRVCSRRCFCSAVARPCC
jgi:multidrug efflux pump subunit AcrB